MLTTLLAILTTIVLAWATGFGAYLWDTSDRIGSRLTIAAVGLMLLLIYLAQWGPPPTPDGITGSLPVQTENSSIAPRRAGRKKDAPAGDLPADILFKWLFGPTPEQPKAP